jgi:hypothetical protein
VAIVCHDAGAANHVIAWINSGLLSGDKTIVMEGPARRLWVSNGFDDAVLCPSLADALDNAASLVSGTGWGSDLEHNARIIARKRNLPSVAVIDHWVNYRPRFERYGELLLPDEIWVTDSYAYNNARREFPDVAVRHIENAYINELLQSISSSLLTPDKVEPEVLYVLEPARSNWGRPGADGEFQALDYLIENIATLGLGSNPLLVLRPHPTDPPKKYDQWIAMHPKIRVRIENSSGLASLIARADCVVGCQTYAMIIALEAGKKVVSTLPPWGPPCSLPHSEIMMLATMVDNANRRTDV